MDVSNIFNFFLLGGGEGGVRGARKGRGVGFFIENPGFSHEGEGRGAGRVSAGNFWGGPKYFFSGPKCPPRSGPNQVWGEVFGGGRARGVGPAEMAL